MRFLSNLQVQMTSRARLGREVGWVLASRLLGAILQLATLVLLARGLGPADFAVVSSVYVLGFIISDLNGFGLTRQMQILQARDAESSRLRLLFNLRLNFTYFSMTLWAATSILIWLISGSNFFGWIIPLALWIGAEQITSTWNGIAIVDQRAYTLALSYSARRAPVVAFLLLSFPLGWDIIIAWVVGLVAGGLLSIVEGWPRSPCWARQLLPPFMLHKLRDTNLEFGFWWSALGNQIRDLDLVFLVLVNPVAAGVYAFPARLVRPMNMVTSAVGNATFPVIARKATVSPRRLLAASAIGALPVIMIAAAVAISAPTVIPRLLGSDYAKSITTLQILCVAAAVAGAGHLITSFLQARTQAATRFAGFVNLASGVAQVLLVTVGSFLGLHMAAVGAVIAYVLMLIPLANHLRTVV